MDLTENGSLSSEITMNRNSDQSKAKLLEQSESPDSRRSTIEGDKKSSPRSPGDLSQDHEIASKSDDGPKLEIEDYRSRLRKRPANRPHYNLIGTQEFYLTTRPNKSRSSPRRRVQDKSPTKAKRSSASSKSRATTKRRTTSTTSRSSAKANEMSDEELECLVDGKEIQRSKSPPRNKSPNNSLSNESLIGNHVNLTPIEKRARSPTRAKKIKYSQDEYYESSLEKAIQIFIPFIIAGLGTVGAGMVLDHVQHWDVFKSVDEIYILLPALLGLKGNLEMTLSSRLSTQAHLGKMRSTSDRILIAKGNIALTQCQATVVSLLACMVAISIQLVSSGQFNLSHALLITASALITSSVASLLLSLLMILVVFVAHSYGVNPDNIASPIAASLGDLLTLSLYAYLTSTFYTMLSEQTFEVLSIAIVVIFLLLIPMWIYATHANPFTAEILCNGWFPIVSAMLIGTASGWILNKAVAKYVGIAVFHPVICGVGGNLVAVQASRLSTYLHKSSGHMGQLPDGQEMKINPFPIVFGRNHNSATVRLLMALAIPGHLFYVAIIAASESGHMKITPMFLLVYVIAAELQILCLLYLAYIMSYSMWLRHINPDNHSIPYLTALGDLFGVAFLMGAFLLMHTLQGSEFDRSMNPNVNIDTIIVGPK